jgi:hypothetical protein
VRRNSLEKLIKETNLLIELCIKALLEKIANTRVMHSVDNFKMYIY